MRNAIQAGLSDVSVQNVALHALLTSIIDRAFAGEL
jgi:hypothetical protein